MATKKMSKSRTQDQDQGGEGQDDETAAAAAAAAADQNNFKKKLRKQVQLQELLGEVVEKALEEQEVLEKKKKKMESKLRITVTSKIGKVIKGLFGEYAYHNLSKAMAGFG